LDPLPVNNILENILGVFFFFKNILGVLIDVVFFISLFFSLFHL